ncbi:hypothetical protein H7X46_02615 [Pseudonocardia sp. C8]|uniref:hypothetical protein n=1 Tax=Pseudonocardia sp. C8 TaxID=2762759 RepID=UPI001642B610|nr:hypothetical protein [Pseudonocardia sp. C8]MBC3189955.1 hypothetical protein [Pseudonocardia sp. C8]
MNLARKDVFATVVARVKVPNADDLPRFRRLVAEYDEAAGRYPEMILFTATYAATDDEFRFLEVLAHRDHWPPEGTPETDAITEQIMAISTWHDVEVLGDADAEYLDAYSELAAVHRPYL